VSGREARRAKSRRTSNFYLAFGWAARRTSDFYLVFGWRARRANSRRAKPRRARKLLPWRRTNSDAYGLDLSGDLDRLMIRLVCRPPSLIEKGLCCVDAS
jgi:hypothetical protein